MSGKTEALYGSVFESAGFGLVIFAPDGIIKHANRVFEKTLGYAPGELSGKSSLDLILAEDRPTIQNLNLQLDNTRQDGFQIIVRFHHKNGESILCHSLFTRAWDEAEQVFYYLGIIGEVQAFENGQQPAFQPAFELFNMFRSIFNKVSDAIFIQTWEGQIVDANSAATELLGYTHDELSKLKTENLLSAKFDYTPLKRASIQESKPVPGIAIHKDGQSVAVEVQYFQIVSSLGKWSLVMMRAINESERSEKLQQAVYRISEAANTAQSLEDLFGLVHQIVAELIPARNFYIALYDPYHDEISFPYFMDERRQPSPTRKGGNGFTEYLIHMGKPLFVSAEKDGSQIDGYLINSYSYSGRLGVPLRTSDERVVGALVVQSYKKDELYRKEDTDILTFVSTQIALAIERKRSQEELRENEIKYRTLFESSTEGFYLFKDVFQDCNEQACRLWVCERNEIIGHNLLDFSPPFQTGGMLSSTMYNLYKEAALEDTPQYFYWTCLCKNGSLIDTEISLKSVVVGGNKYILMTLRDISERLRSDERIRHQLQRLAALRAIDASISTSVDIKITLKLVIESALNLLQIDAGAILMLNQKTNMLEYAASSGFIKTNPIISVHLERGQGYPWKSMLEHRLVVINNLDNDSNFHPSFLSENFTSYFCIPLIAKGEMRGAMELFHHESLSPNQDWFDLLDTLAGQATIALDNSFLFANLKKANEDIVKAYDITIEGWARALEMRDMETEGHSRRVTDLTIDLARKMGVPESQIEHIRRGALLHDIGKMGIPDHVLLKPGPLDESEWEIMRRHPTYAYEMLRDIEFLSPALDIPYFHQERWNGSGYPLGLKGLDIPLPARIFAIVDVWDALTSDRPYRAKWSLHKAAGFIYDNANVLFDPEVVNHFLELIQKVDQSSQLNPINTA